MSIETLLELLCSLKANNGGNAERSHSAWSSGGQSSRPLFNGRRQEYQNSAEDLGQMLQFEKGAPLVNIALGVLGYQAPEVCETMSTHLMDSLRSVFEGGNLSAPILRHIVGSFELIKSNINSRFEEVQGFLRQWCTLRMWIGAFVLELVEIFLDAAVQMNSYSRKSFSTSVYVKTQRVENGGMENDSAMAVEKILDFLWKSKDNVYNQLSPSARLHAWRLRPSFFKQDLSDLARRAMEHPLSSVKAELCSSQTCTTLVESLALAPDMFFESRRVLISWFLSARAVRLLEVRAELSAAVNAILRHPIVWKSFNRNDQVDWPPSYSFYANNHRPYLQVLRGPCTAAALSQLVEMLEMRGPCAVSVTATARSNENKKRGERRKRKSVEMVPQCTGPEKRVKTLEDNRRSIGTLPGAGGGIMSGDSNTAENKGRKRVGSTSLGGVPEAIDQKSMWALLTDFLPWSTVATQMLLQNPTGDNCQTAAKYIAWLLCPSSRDGRAYVTTELLRVADVWHTIVASCEGNYQYKSKNVSHSLAAKKSSVVIRSQGLISDQGHSVNPCRICGALISINLPQRTDEGAHDTLSSGSSYDVLQALQSWLVRLCTLCEDLQQFHVIETDRGPKQPQVSNVRWKLLQVLPLTTLASYPSSLTSEIGVLLLSTVILGFAWRPDKEQNEEKSSPSPSVITSCRACDDFHCRSCCSKDRHQFREPAHRTEQIKDDAAGESYHLEWVPFAAALFFCLDTIFDLREPSGKEPNGANDMLNYLRLVVLCIQHWARLTGPQVFNSSRITGSIYERHTNMLEVLRTRFIAWVDNMKLRNMAEKEFSGALEELELQIALLRSQCS